jgi:hypothetical protein
MQAHAERGNDPVLRCCVSSVGFEGVFSTPFAGKPRSYKPHRTF